MKTKQIFGIALLLSILILALLFAGGMKSGVSVPNGSVISNALITPIPPPDSTSVIGSTDGILIMGLVIMVIIIVPIIVYKKKN